MQRTLHLWPRHLGASLMFCAAVGLFAAAAVPAVSAQGAVAASSTGTLTLTKEATDAAATTFEFSVKGPEDAGTFDPVELTAGNSVSLSELLPGDYSITEIVPEGWKLAAVSCDGTDMTPTDNPISVSVVAGATAACTFTNEAVGSEPDGSDDPQPPVAGTVKLCKQSATGTNLAGWNLGLEQAGDPIRTGTTTDTGCVVFSEVPFDTYSVTEVDQVGWKNVSGLGEFEISEAGTTTRMVINEQLPPGDGEDDEGAEDDEEPIPEEPVDPGPLPQCGTGANLLADRNGGFEAPIVDTEALWDTFLSEAGSLIWSVAWLTSDSAAPEPATLELHAGVNGWSPAVGGQYAELDGDWEGPGGGNGEAAAVSISQTIASESNATYTLHWQFSPRPGTAANENVLTVAVTDATDTVLASSSQTADGSSNEDTAWQAASTTFVGTGGDVTISFSDGGVSNAEGTFLDDVRLTCTTPSSEPTDEDDGGGSTELGDDDPAPRSSGGGGGGRPLGRDDDDDDADDDDSFDDGADGSADAEDLPQPDPTPVIAGTDQTPPPGEVLGLADNQVSAIPTVAPETGAGGSQQTHAVAYITLTTLLGALALVRRLVPQR